MKHCHGFSHLSSLVVAVVASLFSVTTLAEDVSDQANGPWMMFGFAPYTNDWAVGCRPADPDGAYCYPQGYSVQAPAPPWEFTVEEGGVGEISVQDAAIFGDQY